MSKHKHPKPNTYPVLIDSVGDVVMNTDEIIVFNPATKAITLCTGKEFKNAFDVMPELSENLVFLPKEHRDLFKCVAKIVDNID